MATKRETERDVMLRLLRPGSMSGRQLRIAMEGEGFNKSMPAFFAMMARAEHDGLVECWDNPKIVFGVAIQERWFKIAEQPISCQD